MKVKDFENCLVGLPGNAELQAIHHGGQILYPIESIHAVRQKDSRVILILGTPVEEPEPSVDDSVKCCPDCETPNQFGELCARCIEDRRLEGI